MFDFFHRVFKDSATGFQMDISKFIGIGFSALLFGAIFWFISRLNQRRAAKVLEVGMANTEAVRENTAALRELIAKLDKVKAQ